LLILRLYLFLQILLLFLISLLLKLLPLLNLLHNTVLQCGGIYLRRVHFCVVVFLVFLRFGAIWGGGATAVLDCFWDVDCLASRFYGYYGDFRTDLRWFLHLWFLDLDVQIKQILDPRQVLLMKWLQLFHQKTRLHLLIILHMHRVKLRLQRRFQMIISIDIWPPCQKQVLRISIAFLLILISD